MRREESNLWWSERISRGYDLQPKHQSALAMLDPGHFPLVDLGAGNGAFLEAVEKAFPGQTAFGVEISDAAIAAKLCDARIVQGQLTEWKPDGSPVKGVSLIDVLEHLPDPQSVLEKIRTYADHCIVVCPNFNFITARWDMALGRVPFQNKPARGGHVYWCRYRGLLSLFEAAGWRVERERHLYPKAHRPALRVLFQLRPELFAFEFSFLLKKTG